MTYEEVFQDRQTSGTGTEGHLSLLPGRVGALGHTPGCWSSCELQKGSRQREGAGPRPEFVRPTWLLPVLLLNQI